MSEIKWQIANINDKYWSLREEFIKAGKKALKGDHTHLKKMIERYENE